MYFPKFKLKKDFEVESEFGGVKTKQKIFEKGKEFTTSDGKYIIYLPNEELEFTLDQMRDSKKDGDFLFEEVKSEYDLIIEEISDDDENLVSNWRIQFDVKTTRKKLKEFERIFNECISKIK